MGLPQKFLLPLFVLLFSFEANADNTAHQIDKLVEQYADHKVFSGAILVSRGGDVIYQKGHGLANREWSIANAPDTKFVIASVTKTFTAALTLKLIEQKKLSLDETIDQYLPNFPKDKAKQITVGHLLGHRAGFPRWFSVPGWSEGKFNAHIDKNETLRIIGEQTLMFPPGERYSYTNMDYFLLGIIIETVTKLPFEEALKKEILKPLNMHNTGTASHTAVLDKRASGYRINETGGYSHPKYTNLDVFGAGAAMYSTVQDLFRWEHSFYSNTVLSEESKMRLFEPKNHYGWYVGPLPLNSEKVSPMVHNVDGELPGFGAFITRFIDQQHSIIILSNNAMNNAEKFRMTQDIAEVLYKTGHTRKKLPVSFLLSKALHDGQLGKAMEDYKNTPDEFEAGESNIKAVAQQLMWSGQLEKSIEIFRFNSEIFGQSADAHSSLADAYQQNKQLKLALVHYQKALLIEPNNDGLKQKLESLQ